MMLTVMLGSRLSNTAVLMSVINASTGVEIAGKPKPIAPCDRPAAKIAMAIAAHTSGGKSRPMSERMRLVAARETDQRHIDVFAERDYFEQLTHFGGRGEFLHLCREWRIGARVIGGRGRQQIG